MVLACHCCESEADVHFDVGVVNGCITPELRSIEVVALICSASKTLQYKTGIQQYRILLITSES
jgi:hypothetical protein